MAILTFRYGDKTVVAGFRKAEGSPLGFSNLATHSCTKEFDVVRSPTVKVTSISKFNTQNSEDTGAMNQRSDHFSEIKPYPGVTLSSYSELLSHRHGTAERAPMYG
jgi:hypothetical protein